MNSFLFILHIAILVVLLICLAKIVKSIYSAIKKKNSPGAVYGIILLLVGIVIFTFVLDYKRTWDVIANLF